MFYLILIYNFFIIESYLVSSFVKKISKDQILHIFSPLLFPSILVVLLSYWREFLLFIPGYIVVIASVLLPLGLLLYLKFDLQFDKQRIFLAFLHVFIFNFLILISYYLTQGSLITGYYINNDPVNHAFFTKEIVDGQIINKIYPLGMHTLSAAIVTFLGFDIPISNVITTFYLFSYVLIPLTYLSKRLFNSINNAGVYFVALLGSTSYLNINYLYYGFYSQLSATPFTIGALLLIDQLSNKYRFLLFWLLLFTSIGLYSFSVLPYVVIPILIYFSLFRKNIYNLIPRITAPVLALMIIIMIPFVLRTAQFYYSLLISNKEITHQITYGNLIDYLPIPEIFNMWLVNSDYRIIPGFSSARVIVSYTLMVCLVMVLMYVLVTKIIRDKDLREYIWTLIISSLFIGAVIKVFTDSPYMMGKHFQIISGPMTVLVYCSVFLMIRNIKQTRIFLVLLLGAALISYFISNIYSFKNIPVFKAEGIKSIKVLSNELKAEKVKYFGINDWLLFYFDKNALESGSTAYATEAFSKDKFVEDVNIFDVSQSSQILSHTQNERIVYFDNYFMATSNKDYNSFQSPVLGIYKLYEEFSRDKFHGLNVGRYKDVNNLEYVSINFNPINEESCVNIKDLSISKIVFNLSKPAYQTNTNGVDIKLYSNNIEIAKYPLKKDTGSISLNYHDVVNKQICFDPINDPRWDWILVRVE